MTALLLLLIAVTVYLLLRYARPGDGKRLFGTPQSAEAQWEEKVLRLTRANRGAMERAITARRRKYPQATRLELLKLVHDEYLKDRE